VFFAMDPSILVPWGATKQRPSSKISETSDDAYPPSFCLAPPLSSSPLEPVSERVFTKFRYLSRMTTLQLFVYICEQICFKKSPHISDRPHETRGSFFLSLKNRHRGEGIFFVTIISEFQFHKTKSLGKKKKHGSLGDLNSLSLSFTTETKGNF